MSEPLSINTSGPPPAKSTTKRIAQFLAWAFNRIVFVVARWIFAFCYRDAETLPPVEEPLLLDSAVSLADKIRTGQAKSEDVVKLFIARIGSVNASLNCLVENRFDDALKEAREADELISGGTVTEEWLKREKPLLGVPFTTKDCIMVKDLHHTAGLVSRKNVVAKDDAECIGHLRKAGAIPLGLTNVSELAMWWESHNRMHGRTNNPYDNTRIVGGSSGGEGCIQGAVGSAFGVGSDIGGSIRMPAFFNGVFGHKPSKFIVSNHGQYPSPVSQLQESFLGLGPITRKATDLKPLLKIMSGANSTLLNLEEPVDLKKIKVYFQRECLNDRDVSPVDLAIKIALNNAVRHMQTVCELKPKEVRFEKFAIGTKLWLASMNIKDSMSFMERLTGKDNSLNIWIEVLKCLFGKSKHTFIALMTALIEKVGPQPGSKEHSYMLKLRQDLENEFKELLGDDGVFLYPTHPTAAPYHNEPLIRIFNFSYTAVINVLGLPATHIPMGLDENGLPIGIQVVSTWNNDRLCLAIAEELEKAFGGWVDPATAADKKRD